MDTIFSLLIYFLFGTIIIVVIGVIIQLKQQSKSKQNEIKQDNQK
jgi:hypothetical protein